MANWQSVLRVHHLISLKACFFLLLFGCADDAADVSFETAEPVRDPVEQADVPSEASGPLHITIERPARGAVLNQADVPVAGVVSNLGRGTLSINETLVVPDDDGRFSFDVAVGNGFNRIVTEAKRGDEHSVDHRGVIIGAQNNLESKLENALTLHLGTRGLDALGRIVSRAVNELDITEVIQGHVTEDGNVRVKSVHYNGLLVDLLPRNGFLKVRLVLQDLRIQFRGQFEVLFVPVVVHGDAKANAVTIEANLHVRRTNEGSIEFDVRSRSVDVRGFDLDVENVANGITELFDNTARRLAERLLSNALSDFVVPYLFSEDMLDQRVEVMGKRIGIDLDVDRMMIDESGLTMILGSTLSVPERIHEMGVASQYPGLARRPTDAGVQLAASVDFLNRLLAAAWSSGALDLEYSSSDEMFGTLGVPLLRIALGDAGEDLSNSDSLRYRMRPLLPPAARLVGTSEPLQLEMSDIMLDIIGPEGTLVTLALDFSASMGLAAADGDDLSVEPRFDVNVTAKVVEMPVGLVNASALEQQIESIFELLPQHIAQETYNLGNAATPLPLRIFDVGFSVDGDRDWLDLNAFFDVQ